MAKLTPNRTFALATLAVIAVALATPACAKMYDRNGSGRTDLVYLPEDANCAARVACDLARY